MGDTVVFTVSLEPDRERQPADNAGSAFWDSVRQTVPRLTRAPSWRAAVLVSVALPVLVAAIAAGMPRLSVGPEMASVATLTLCLMVVGAVTAASAAALHADAEHGQPLGARAWPERAHMVAATATAAWLASLLALALSTPVLAWVFWRSGWGEAQLLPLVVLQAGLVGMSCAIGLAVARGTRGQRPQLIAALGVLTVALGPIVLFVASLPLVSTEDRVTTYTYTVGYTDEAGTFYPASNCSSTTVTEIRAHTERTWWLLGLSPVISAVDAPQQLVDVLVDAPERSYASSQVALRMIRSGPEAYFGGCYLPRSTTTPEAVREKRLTEVESLAGYGLPMYGAITAISMVTALVRTPASIAAGSSRRREPQSS